MRFTLWRLGEQSWCTTPTSSTVARRTGQIGLGAVYSAHSRRRRQPLIIRTNIICRRCRRTFGGNSLLNAFNFLVSFSFRRSARRSSVPHGHTVSGSCAQCQGGDTIDRMARAHRSPSSQGSGQTPRVAVPGDPLRPERIGNASQDMRLPVGLEVGPENYCTYIQSSN
jgi:hypothetical protein